MTRDPVKTGALLLGAGVAGYALGHWLDRRDDAEPPPAAPHPPERNARSGNKRYTLEGRTILRDGVEVIEITRIDLGDQRYALSPYETDLLTKRIVRLLNAGR